MKPSWVVLVKKALVLVVTLCILSVHSFFVYDYLSPVDLQSRSVATVVLAKDGETLRQFADEQGVFRFHKQLAEIDPVYLQMLLAYEDQYFYQHPGVNPFSLLRAMAQWLRSGQIISGGSTITMQVARIRYPVKHRGMLSKLKQMLVALQLEWHFSKEEILTYYVNHAPFGGNIEGVQAAANKYFNIDANFLSDGQAALLAVLPQAPSRYRPDRYPHKAQNAKNKLLHRFAQSLDWSPQRLQQALAETVEYQQIKQPMFAAIFARQLKARFSEKSVIHSTVDYELQRRLEQLVEQYSQQLPQGMGAAVVVLDNQQHSVLAYVGSAEFANKQRFGYVDMIQARRSHGSTLKPFIYAKALEEQLIHEQSLLHDVPLDFANYRPSNFHRGFSGAVSVRQALSESLNIPAVQLLSFLQPANWLSWMNNYGANLQLPKDSQPNLSIALGGVSASLMDLTTCIQVLQPKDSYIPFSLYSVISSDNKHHRHF